LHSTSLLWPLALPYSAGCELKAEIFEARVMHILNFHAAAPLQACTGASSATDGGGNDFKPVAGHTYCANTWAKEVPRWITSFPRQRRSAIDAIFEKTGARFFVQVDFDRRNWCRVLLSSLLFFTNLLGQSFVDI
jgi:roadblock/LC7 domain-containing protein